MASARSLHTFNRGKQLNWRHAGLSTCRKPQKCRLRTSTQSRSCPSKKTDKKANQKQQSKPKRQKTQTTTPTKQKRQREFGIVTSNGNYVHDDILCVILRMTQNKKQNSISVGERSNKAPCGNQGSPQPGFPRSQRAAVQA